MKGPIFTKNQLLDMGVLGFRFRVKGPMFTENLLLDFRVLGFRVQGLGAPDIYIYIWSRPGGLPPPSPPHGMVPIF